MIKDQLSLVSGTRPPAAATVSLPAPQTLADAGLSSDLVSSIVLKTLYYAGELSGAEVAKRLGVVFSVIESALEFLKAQKHLEVVGGAVIGGASYRYRITTAGRDAAAMFLEQSQYVGALPVPLDQYQRYMAGIASAGRPLITRAGVREAYAHLVLSDEVLDEIGPAIMSGHSMFIYGPPGNGKTIIAHGIAGLLKGNLAIPHAIEVEGQIIRVLDPASHHPIGETPDEGLSVDVDTDRRWVVCRRPVVAVGGELTLESLDLTFDTRMGFYHAPLQLVANGGLLIVDDFGRQRCSPRDLLNRWMVPLESGVDYLTLRSGLKFDVPFQLFVAFATNLKPWELVDEAFLRRVQYKVHAKDPSEEEFILMFEKCCRDQDVPFERTLVQQLMDGFYHVRGLPRRACQPRDLINQALALASYRGEPRRLTLELLETACRDYFVGEGA